MCVKPVLLLLFFVCSSSRFVSRNGNEYGHAPQHTTDAENEDDADNDDDDHARCDDDT